MQMRVGILGINYKSSDLHIREKLARACQRLFGNESQEAARLSIVLLSTCNRTEIYFTADDLSVAHSELLSLLREHVPFSFEHNLYSYFGSECFAHLARVTSGLDSAIVAETEIQRQVKMAYASASLDHTLKSPIHFLFQKCLKVGKNIRSSFSLPRGMPTLESLSFELAQKFIKKFSVLFVGNSEINRKILSFFKSKGILNMTLCTRGLHSAQELAAQHQLNLLDWNQVHAWQTYEVVICGSYYQDYILSPEQITQDFSQANRLILDLGMPRNVDPRLGRHPEIQLFNIEELGNLVSARRSVCMQNLSQAEERLRKNMEHLFRTRENKQSLKTLHVQEIAGRG